MSSRRHTSLCREGWYYLFVLAFVLGGAVLREVNLLLLLAGLMVGPLLFSWRLALATLRQLSVRRTAPASVGAGEPFTVEITLANRRRRLGNWALVAEDRIEQETVEGATPAAVGEAFFSYVGPGEEATARYRCTLTRRGRYRLRAVELSTKFPFGFVRGLVRLPCETIVTVCPRIGELTSEWRRLIESRRIGTHHASPRRGVDGDYYGLRDWRQGDTQRWVHWRSTAKRGQLTVLEFEQQRNLDVVLLLDLYEPAEADERRKALTELAVSFAASAIVQLSRQGGDSLSVAAAGRELHSWTGTASRVYCQELLEQLAIVQAGDSTRFASQLAAACDRASAMSRVIVLSTRPADGAMLAALHAALDRVTGEHRQAVWLDMSGDEWTRYFHV